MVVQVHTLEKLGDCFTSTCLLCWLKPLQVCSTTAPQWAVPTTTHGRCICFRWPHDSCEHSVTRIPLQSCMTEPSNAPFLAIHRLGPHLNPPPPVQTLRPDHHRNQNNPLPFPKWHPLQNGPHPHPSLPTRPQPRSTWPPHFPPHPHKQPPSCPPPLPLPPGPGSQPKQTPPPAASPPPQDLNGDQNGAEQLPDSRPPASPSAPPSLPPPFSPLRTPRPGPTTGMAPSL